MKYPPTSVAGWPESACQRSGSVKVDIGTGTVSTVAEAGRSSEAKAADQPGGTGVAAAAGRGRGTIGRTARTAQAMTTAVGHDAQRRLDASGGRPRPGTDRANAASAGMAASAQKASSAAAMPSARMENRSGSAALNS